MKILFMCVANSARSQMAEGIARLEFDKQVQIASAGSNPATVNPCALQVLAEVGIDISTHHSKLAAGDVIDGVDLVVTLCAEEVCPRLPGHVRHLHWPMPDPASVADAATKLDAFREVRDALRVKIKGLAMELNLAPAPS